MNRVLSLVLLLGLSGCSDLCGNDVWKEAYSPNRRLKAVVFDRDCGATTRAYTQVMIIDASEDVPNEPGNVFGVDDGTASIEVSWMADSKLLVTYPRYLKNVHKSNSVMGVEIQYQEE
ncbi:MAG: hypothetical protein HYX26_10345 [Acidobacteriales bacterium]|nr:hypothetical protein [Terriglobales bacterium]